MLAMVDAVQNSAVETTVVVAGGSSPVVCHQPGLRRTGAAAYVVACPMSVLELRAFPARSERRGPGTLPWSTVSAAQMLGLFDREAASADHRSR